MDVIEFEADNLSMTQLEQKLKYCLSLRPDIAKKVLTAEELTEYQQWISSTFANESRIRFSSSEVTAFPNISRSHHNLQQMQSYSGSNPVTGPEYVHRDIITENQEILTNYDISVGRMLRYFPSHWHANDSFEIYYALSGTCPIYFKDEVINVKPGTVLIIAPSVLHASPCYSDDSVLLYYLVRSSTFDRVFWDQFSSENLMSAFFRQALSSQHTTAYLHFETGDDSGIKTLLYRIYQEYCLAERYGSQMLNALMSEFFVLLLRRYEGTARLPRTKDFYWKHEFSAILTYIQSNFASATQADVAERFHYSERQIGRIVQNCIGMTYAQLILKLRMQQAGKLLRQNSIPIDTISSAVGYSTPCSFYRAFLKYYGCTPRAYSAHLSDEGET